MTRDILVYSKDYNKQYLTENLYAGDCGYRIVLRCAMDVSEAEVEGIVLRADGVSVVLSGSCDGRTAYCTLSASALAVAGEWRIRIRVIKDGSVITATELEGMVSEEIETNDIVNDDRLPILTSLIKEVSNLKIELEEHLAYRGEISTIVGIISDNAWKTGWYWYVSDGGSKSDIDWYEGEVILAVADHPDTEIAESEFYNYFRILGKQSVEAVAELKSSCLKLGYTWYIDTDTVKNASGQSVGTLQRCMTDTYNRYIGAWFYVRTTASEAGQAAYPSTYEIDGANGYLSLRDYVVWTGTHLVHIPTYEAKSSTVKNSDGKYSPKSGVDGLMSSTDKAYLTDLINAYWNTKLSTGTSVNANECLENGFYAPMTLGRPNGVKEGERLGLMTIKDTVNGGVVQLCISFNYEGRAWFRSSPDNSADNFSEWKPLWRDNPFNKLYTQTSGGMANWNTEIAIYDTVLGSTSGGLPPIQNNNYAFILINFPGAPAATTPYALTQVAIDKVSGAIHMRFAPNYSGSGSLSGAGEWETITENKEVKAVALETRIDDVESQLSDINQSAEDAASAANAAKQEAEDALMAAAWAQEYADGLYNESWKDEPVLTIEITEECMAIDVTEIDGQPFYFERLGGYAELVTNAAAEGRLCILLNKTGSGASYSGLVCMNTNGSSTEGNIQKGIFEVKREFGMWHTANVATSTDTWLALNSYKYEHWDSRGYFADVENITSFRLIPYSGVFNAGTVIKIYGKPPKEVTA